MPHYSKAAREFARQHNSGVNLHEGAIYRVNLTTGQIGVLVATFAANQYGPDSPYYGTHALFRIMHSKLTLAEAQRFIDEKGQGW